jgi:hypothetical protein
MQPPDVHRLRGNPDIRHEIVVVHSRRCLASGSSSLISEWLQVAPMGERFKNLSDCLQATLKQRRVEVLGGLQLSSPDLPDSNEHPIATCLRTFFSHQDFWKTIYSSVIGNAPSSDLSWQLCVRKNSRTLVSSFGNLSSSSL